MMKKHLIALTALLAVSIVSISPAKADVGASLTIGQPGFYEQLDIGNYYPRPQLIYSQPRVIHVVPAYQYAQPIYLRVPSGYANRWSNYCDRYNACGRPVYFVQDTWYQNVYAPRYQQYHQRGDDGRRYDRDYWDRHNDRRDYKQGHYDGHDNRRYDGPGNGNYMGNQNHIVNQNFMGNRNHHGNGPDRNHGNGSGDHRGGYDRGGNDRGGHDRGHGNH